MKSVYLTARALVPHMKENGAGAVLNVASTAGVSPRPKLNWYNASKGWMITATKTMAIELAPFGIRVNALNPVAGETPLLKSFLGEDTPEKRAKVSVNHSDRPLLDPGRYGQCGLLPLFGRSQHDYWGRHGSGWRSWHIKRQNLFSLVS